MVRRFAKVSEEEIEEAYFFPSDLVNIKTTIPLRVGEERRIYTSTLRVSVYIYHYSFPLRGIVLYYLFFIYIIYLLFFLGYLNTKEFKFDTSGSNAPPHSGHNQVPYSLGTKRIKCLGYARRFEMISA